MLSAVSFLSPERPVFVEINILKTGENGLRDNYRSEQSHLKMFLKEDIFGKVSWHHLQLCKTKTCISGSFLLTYLNFCFFD